MIGHRIVLRPRNLIETGDLALAMVRLHVREFARLLAWVLVPAALALLVQAVWRPAPLLTWALLFAGTAVGSGVYVVLCGDLILQPQADLGDVQRRFRRMLAGFALARLMSWLGAWALLGFVYANAAFVPECSLLEHGKLGTAMARSGALMRAVPGRAIGFAVVVAALTCGAAVAGELARYYVRDLFGLANTTIRLSGDEVGWASALGVALVMPYLAAMRFLLYIDARTRREGWDLQVQMAALVHVAEHPGLAASRAAEVA